MYGIEVLTQSGMRNITDMLSVRLLATFRSQQPSGSYTAPAYWNPGSDGYFAVSAGSYQTPNITVNGRNFNWQSYGGGSVDFTFYLFAVNSQVTEGGYGFIARNGGGSVVMDQRYSTLSVKSRGVSNGALAASSRPSGSYLHSINCSSTDIVAARVDVGMYVATGSHANGSRSMFHSSSVMEYLVLEASPGTPGEGDYGLVLYDTDGNRTYDSRVPIMAVRSTQSGTAGMAVTIQPTDRFVACVSPFWLWIDELHPMLGVYFGTQMFFGFERTSSTLLSTRGINGIAAQSGTSPVYGPIPNDASLVAIIGHD